MSFTQQQIEDLRAQADQWLDIDINPDSAKEIEHLKSVEDYATLNDKFGSRIAFGTAGLRAAMKSVFAYMNDVTVLQASQGLVQYILDTCVAVPAKPLSLVVGYDHRYNSQRFGEITASVALSKGLTVYYLGNVDNLSEESLKFSKTKHENVLTDKSYVHTPMVPFTIDNFGASAGVMVTASHNPANDNGYKVYYSNGCQIIPPHDHGIATSIDSNLAPWKDVWDVAKAFKSGIESGRLILVKGEMTIKYLDQIKELIKYPHLGFDFVYTPIHGVGNEIMTKCMESFDGFNMKVVEQQQQPDPGFPTVAFPNPEEKGALTLATETADNLGYKLVIANDPDADRFSCSVKTEHGWQQLTGNEIGFLFAMYIIENTPKEELGNTWLVNSTVSSQILDSMAEKDGFNFTDTLTGFKWIGNKAIDLKKEGYKVPFAYEEAIGFMFNIVNDKDGVSAAVIFLQLYHLWFSQGTISPIEKLKQGYEKYGYFKECNGYYRLHEMSTMNTIFADIRGGYKHKPYPETIGTFQVTKFRDLTVGYDSSTDDNKPILPVDSSSQMITCLLTNEQGQQVRFTSRGSGTEPKLKVYIEGKGANEQEAISVARECWEQLKQHWFLPKKYNLQEVLNT